MRKAWMVAVISGLALFSAQAPAIMAQDAEYHAGGGGISLFYDGGVLLSGGRLSARLLQAGAVLPVDERHYQVTACQTGDAGLQVDFVAPVGSVPPGLEHITLTVGRGAQPGQLVLNVQAPGLEPGRAAQTIAWEFSGELHWGQRPILSRLTPDDNPYLVQMALGERFNSARCDTLFDPDSDCGLTLASPGQLEVPFVQVGGGYRVRVATPPSASPALTAAVTRDVYRVGRDVRYYAPIDKSYFPLPPSGWCSWYFYYQNISEKTILENAQWMANVLKPYGAQYIQIDDGWQGAGYGVGDNRDWETVNGRFPRGMKALSDDIHALGMKSGLWLAPFGQSNDEFVKAHRDVFLWRPDGTSVGYTLNPTTGQAENINWEGKYIVDSSTRAGQDYLRQLFQRLAGWGFDYFKIDGQPVVEALYDQYSGELGDRGRSPEASYRLGLQAIREAIGPQRFLLGCWGTPLSGAGIMNGSRTGGDITANWAGFQPALDATLGYYYLHNILWYDDPDVLVVRPPLTLDQARVWASLLGLTGQAVMFSDNMPALTPDRVEILKRVLPTTDIRPVDLYPYKVRVNIWNLRISKDGETWDVIGLFNWDAKNRTLKLDPKALGLPEGSYQTFDFWDQKYLGRRNGPVRLNLPPTSCKVLAVRRALDRPQILSTTRHITQGWVDLAGVRWDARENRLSGTSQVVGGDDYRIFVSLPTAPRSYQLGRVELTGADTGAGLETSVTGGMLTLRLRPQASGEVHWNIYFRVRPGRAAVAPPAPVNLAVQAGKGSLVNLSWQAGSAAAEGIPASTYRVYRNGETISEVLGTQFQDTPPQPATTYTYQVAAVGVDGSQSPLSTPAAFTTGDTIYLSDLTPSSAMQGWGTLGMDKSVNGSPLQIGQTRYEKGLGTHADSEIVYDLGGAYKEFRAVVGVDHEVGNQGSVIFAVYVDGRQA